jgi:hydroxymethylpyrimidine pyrophosphatase-like HAD family hydrolase
MNRYDALYELYDEFDAETLRQFQELADVFPAVGSRVALEQWQEIRDELDRRKGAIRESFPTGETFAAVAANASHEEAFTALDLLGKYDRAVNVLVLDVDETLRSAGRTDNEIPRETLSLLTKLHEGGMPIVICTGQTLENVKGFITQGLGNELVHSGRFSIVYEAGNGVFTPGHGPDTKRLLYDDLDADVRGTFDEIRSRVLPEAPERVKTGCHLQGNEFTVTLKPNFQTGSDRADAVIDEALVYLLDLLGDVLDDASAEAVRAFYADADPEIRGVLERGPGVPDVEVPEGVAERLRRLEVGYYEGDAAELGSYELDKVAGVEAAFDVLGIDDPFALVMGDSKSDLRVMEWVDEEGMGIAAAPNHASEVVLEHVLETDDLVFERDGAASMLRMTYALDRLAGLE